MEGEKVHPVLPEPKIQNEKGAKNKYSSVPLHRRLAFGTHQQRVTTTMRVKKDASHKPRYPKGGTVIQKLCVIPEQVKVSKQDKEPQTVRFDERLQEIEKKKRDQQIKEEKERNPSMERQRRSNGEEENYILCKNTPEKNEAYEFGALSMLYSKKSLFS